MRVHTFAAVALFEIFCIIMPITVKADSFRVASYNVENLFDMQINETEYPEYRPGGKAGWNRAMLAVKLKNTATVIHDLDAGIIALQEIESENALALLRKELVLLGVDYPYQAIAEKRMTPVKCALLSRFPIIEKNEIITERKNARSILQVTVTIAGHPLVVYVNHWKSKSGPESERINYARALAGGISKLACDADFILIGDFNADYNEYETFKHILRLNDTRGVTGINHILNTLAGENMVTESVLRNQEGCTLLYNLWLEIPESRRWSVNFFGRKNSPDSIIVPKGLYDATGISYVDNSFDKFDPDYLFEDDRVFRWHRDDGGRGRHLGRGYSDHLPVLAEFEIGSFVDASQVKPACLEPETLDIADLYGCKKGSVSIRITGAAVIFKENGNAIIKQKNGRAIYVYKAAGELEYGNRYDLIVTHLHYHYGNLEITDIADIRPVGRETDMDAYYIKSPLPDLSVPELRNEVVEQVKGVYENGWLHYRKDLKIRLYFADPALKPEDLSVVRLSRVRIGYHRHPEIIVEKSMQVSEAPLPKVRIPAH